MTHDLTLRVVPQRLEVLPGRFVVARRADVADDADLLAWIDAPGDPTVVVRVGEEHPEPWVAVSSRGSAHGLDAPGMTASLLVPLALARIGVFVTSTFEADLVLVPLADLDAALDALSAAGHVVPRDLDSSGRS